MIAFASSLDQGGPMARKRRGLRAAAQRHGRLRRARFDLLDRPAEDYAATWKALDGLTPRPAQRNSSAKAATVRDGGAVAAIAEYENSARRPVEILPAQLPSPVPAYYVIAPAEASSNLSRFDGVRYGYRAPGIRRPRRHVHAHPRPGLRRRGQAAHPDRHLRAVPRLLRRLLTLQAQRIRRLIADDFVAAFKVCDVILRPTSPSTAFKLGKGRRPRADVPLRHLHHRRQSGRPARHVDSCGFADGLPVGLQLIGNFFPRRACSTSPIATSRQRLASAGPAGVALTPPVAWLRSGLPALRACAETSPEAWRNRPTGGSTATGEQKIESQPLKYLKNRNDQAAGDPSLNVPRQMRDRMRSEPDHLNLMVREAQVQTFSAQVSIPQARDLPLSISRISTDRHPASGRCSKATAPHVPSACGNRAGSHHRLQQLPQVLRGEAFSYLWPILVDAKTGRALNGMK